MTPAGVDVESSQDPLLVNLNDPLTVYRFPPIGSYGREVQQPEHATAIVSSHPRTGELP
jgi:hypothetical protein